MAGNYFWSAATLNTSKLSDILLLRWLRLRHKVFLLQMDHEGEPEAEAQQGQRKGGVRASQKKTTVCSIPIVLTTSIPIHSSVQLLLQCRWPVVAQGIQLKAHSPDRWLPVGVTLRSQMSIGFKSPENPGCDLHTSLWLKLPGINGFLQSSLVISRMTIDTLLTFLCLQKKKKKVFRKTKTATWLYMVTTWVISNNQKLICQMV